MCINRPPEAEPAPPRPYPLTAGTAALSALLLQGQNLPRVSLIPAMSSPHLSSYCSGMLRGKAGSECGEEGVQPGLVITERHIHCWEGTSTIGNAPNPPTSKMDLGVKTQVGSPPAIRRGGCPMPESSSGSAVGHISCEMSS